MGKLRLKIATPKPFMSCQNSLMFQWKICFIKTMMFVTISRPLRVIFAINLKNWASKNSLCLLKTDEVTDYMNKKWYPEALYLLAMLDYVSRINNIPICKKYNSYRSAKLSEVIYPASVVAEAKVMNDESILKDSITNSIPKFIRFNIVESEVFDVA